jgi:hypothetical protein
MDLLNPHQAGKPLNNRPVLSLLQHVGLGESDVFPHPTLTSMQLRSLPGQTRKENMMTHVNGNVKSILLDDNRTKSTQSCRFSLGLRPEA